MAHLPKVMEIKMKINKWNLIKLKSFGMMKENISKVKRQLSEWEKIKTNERADKELMSKRYKQLMQLNMRKMNSPIQTCTKHLERCFSKENMQFANKHMKRVSTSLIIQFSHSDVSNSLQPHESQHTRPPCPSPTPRVHPNPCPLSR